MHDDCRNNVFKIKEDTTIKTVGSIAGFYYSMDIFNIIDWICQELCKKDMDINIPKHSELLISKYIKGKCAVRSWAYQGSFLNAITVSRSIVLVLQCTLPQPRFIIWGKCVPNLCKENQCILQWKKSPVISDDGNYDKPQNVLLLLKVICAGALGKYLKRLLWSYWFFLVVFTRCVANHIEEGMRIA